ncbi:MAG: very short patch repair endonuclease [bacterium]|nr:very short patch repair endonuclease [bacterium]
MDTFTKKKRSEVMSKIRSKNTGIEKIIFRELRKRKIYFQRYYSKAIGHPDIALPKKKKAVFVDGDFWHGWRFAKTRKRLPKKYWQAKIENNIKRDKKNRAKLKREGWKVLRVWEHEIEKDLNLVIKKIIYFLSN